jgi:hypothetical protein
MLAPAYTWSGSRPTASVCWRIFNIVLNGWCCHDAGIATYVWYQNCSDGTQGYQTAFVNDAFPCP